MATGTPSLTASQKTPTERYSMPPSTCGSSIAELENEASITNLAEVRAPDHVPHISPPNAEMLTSDMEIADTDQGEWYDAKTSKKRKKNSSSSKSGDTVTNSPTTTVGLTVIFVPAVENQKITAISSLKLSVALEQMCPECIQEIRPNSRLNLIAVDTRNGQTTRALLACTQICGLKVRAYEPVPRHFAVGVIKDVDTSLSDAEIEQHNTINETSNKQNPSAHGYAAALKKNQQKLMKGALPSNDRKTQVSEPKGEKERPSTSAAATPDPMRKTTSISDAPPIKGNAWESWIPLLKKAARMAYGLLSSVDAQWARNITSLLHMILPLMGEL
ncbi:hypothetical protein HPB47_004005 [Ixodes persulcatus]|uniref:Uncharacterized protein n=1 Tax=Ixodes persulcatus TaxID=34615 RepID=A0AC60PHX8_IXOPE|nr:hypothetical protein HPB47_004005 [Ixodes persulcatus]